MDIFTLFEQANQKKGAFIQKFVGHLKSMPQDSFFKTDAKGQNILHKILSADNISYDTVDLVLSRAPQLANMADAQGRLPAQVIWPNPMTYYRAVRTLLYEKTNNLEVKKQLLLQADIHLGRPRMNSNKTNDWEAEDCFNAIDIDEANSLLKKPTLICFSGRGAHQEKIVSRFVRVSRSAFHLYYKPLSNFQVLGACYPGTSQDLYADVCAFDSPFLRADAESPYFYAERFVKRFLRPLYMNEKKKQSFETALKNLRNVNMFAYSYGASVMQLISDALYEDMKVVAGFNENQIKSLQSQIFVLTAGANISPNNYKNYFSTYHIMNSEDDIVFPLMRPLLKIKKMPDGAFEKTFLFRQPNQKVLLFSDKYTAFEGQHHHVCSYFPEHSINKGHAKALFVKDCILTNAINNSIENMLSKDFLPLGNLEKIPTKCLFFENPTDQEEHIQLLQAQKRPVLRVSHRLRKAGFDLQKVKE